MPKKTEQQKRAKKRRAKATEFVTLAKDGVFQTTGAPLFIGRPDIDFAEQIQAALKLCVMPALKSDFVALENDKKLKEIRAKRIADYEQQIEDNKVKITNLQEQLKGQIDKGNDEAVELTRSRIKQTKEVIGELKDTLTTVKEQPEISRSAFPENTFIRKLAPIRQNYEAEVIKTLLSLVRMFREWDGCVFGLCQLLEISVIVAPNKPDPRKLNLLSAFRDSKIDQAEKILLGQLLTKIEDSFAEAKSLNFI